VSDHVISPPEPEEIDDKLSIELRHLSTGPARCGSGSARIGEETIVELVPYFQSGSPPIETGHEAFLRVRVTKDLEPNGSLTVLLPGGTALRVHGRDLLRIKDGLTMSAGPK